jgi:hypothetical protein
MEPGTLLFDPATNRVGEYQDHSGPYAMLRPLGGGREWQADPAVLRSVTDGERLSAEVRAANGRARAAVRPPAPAATDAPFLLAAARAGHDHSAETDANVPLRQRQRQEHSA